MASKYPWREGTKQLPVDPNGRLVLPKEWREQLGIVKKGQHLHAYLDGHRIVLTDGTEFLEALHRKPAKKTRRTAAPAARKASRGKAKK